MRNKAATTCRTREDAPDDDAMGTDEATPDDPLPPDEEVTPPAAKAPTSEQLDAPFVGGTKASLTLSKDLSHDDLRAVFVKVLGRPTPKLLLSNEDYYPGDLHKYGSWDVRIQLPPKEASAAFKKVEAQLDLPAYFPSSNVIGGKVAGDTRVKAIMALLASLVCIVGYIWIRFQRVVFGLAAVVALVHDVLITLGVLALTAFVADPLWFLLLDPFKIGLPVLAAFLTIIGYSLNDTIVVFDRIREVRGKSPNLTEGMVNARINQTLARTLLTSVTTLVVVLILYVAGGQPIHAFAFSLVVGVIVGTYSSIFVASPALLWMSSTSGTK